MLFVGNEVLSKSIPKMAVLRIQGNEIGALENFWVDKHLNLCLFFIFWLIISDTKFWD